MVTTNGEISGYGVAGYQVHQPWKPVLSVRLDHWNVIIGRQEGWRCRYIKLGGGGGGMSAFTETKNSFKIYRMRALERSARFCQIYQPFCWRYSTTCDNHSCSGAGPRPLPIDDLLLQFIFQRAPVNRLDYQEVGWNILVFFSFFPFTTDFFVSRLFKSKRPWKRFQDFRQSYRWHTIYGDVSFSRDWNSK